MYVHAFLHHLYIGGGAGVLRVATPFSQLKSKLDALLSHKWYHFPIFKCLHIRISLHHTMKAGRQRSVGIKTKTH